MMMRRPCRSGCRPRPRSGHRKNAATPAEKAQTVEKAQPAEKAQAKTTAKTKTMTKTRKTNEAWK